VIRLVVYLDASHSVTVSTVLLPRRPLFATPLVIISGRPHPSPFIHPLLFTHSIIHHCHNLLISVILLACLIIPPCCCHSAVIILPSFSFLFSPFSLLIPSWYLDPFDLAGSKIPTNRKEPKTERVKKKKGRRKLAVRHHRHHRIHPSLFHIILASLPSSLPHAHLFLLIRSPTNSFFLRFRHCLLLSLP
jgi:hypothetical protein